MRPAFDLKAFDQREKSFNAAFAMLIHNYNTAEPYDPHYAAYRLQFINAFIAFIKHQVDNYNNTQLPGAIRKACLMNARSHNDTLQLTLKEHGATAEQRKACVNLGKRLNLLYITLCTSAPISSPPGDGPADDYCDASKLTPL